MTPDLEPEPRLRDAALALAVTPEARAASGRFPPGALHEFRAAIAAYVARSRARGLDPGAAVVELTAVVRAALRDPDARVPPFAAERVAIVAHAAALAEIA